jgi:hypothetical protein
MADQTLTGGLEGLAAFGGGAGLPDQVTETVEEQSQQLSGGAQPAAPGVQPEGRTPVVMDTDRMQDRVSDATRQVEDMGAQVQDRVQRRRVVGTPDQELQKLAQEQEDIFANFQSRLSAFEEGAIPFTSDEQASLNAIQGAFNDARKAQARANRRASSGAEILQVRTGRARFAPEIATGEVQDVIQTGLDKLETLDVRAAGALADAQTAIKQRNFENLLKSQAKLEDSIARRQRTFADLRSAAIARAKLAGSISQFDMSGLTAKQREKLLNNKTVLKAKARIDLIRQMKNFENQIREQGGGLTGRRLSRRERKALQGTLMQTVGPALAFANAQGALTESEQKDILASLGPGRQRKQRRIFKTIENTISGQNIGIDTDFALLESAIPGVTDQFSIFADWKFENMADDDFFGTSFTPEAADVDDLEYFNFEL